MYSKGRRNWSYEDLLGKAMKYCAYQERCISELRNKLFEWNTNKSNTEKIIDKIIDEGFINEKRYTEFYVKGKVNIKKWGKIKIRAALRQKQIPEEIIAFHLNSIPEKTYLENIMCIAEKKLNELESEEDLIKRKQKTFHHLASKGYESEIIASAISQIMK